MEVSRTHVKFINLRSRLKSCYDQSGRNRLGADDIDCLGLDHYHFS